MTHVIAPPNELILPAKKLILPPEIAQPTEAPISCGRRMPVGGQAYDIRSKKWRLRTIQRRMGGAAKQLADRWRHSTVVAGAPGCGKSAGVALFFWELRAAGLSRFLLWVVPNTTLLKQAQETVKSYLGPNFKLVAGTNKAYRTIAGEDPDCIGVVLTYSMLNQTIKGPDGLATNAYTAWIARLRQATECARRVGQSGGVTIAWDECHHLADVADAEERFQETDETDPGAEERNDSFRPWCAIAHEMHRELVVKDGGHSLLLTGTLERDDRHALPIVDYCDDHDPEAHEKCAGTSRASDFVSNSTVRGLGRSKPVTPHVHVECSYQEAYKEGSLKRIKPLDVAARSKYQERGKNKPTENRTDDAGLTPREQSDAVYTALNDQSYMGEAIDRCVTHWRDHRKEAWDGWRMLAICWRQDAAAGVAAYMLKRGLRVGLAISGGGKIGTKARTMWSEAGGVDEPGKVALERFKKGDHDILVTVAMAHEGYDVPEISHVLFFTTYRTSTYCTQAFTRGARVCQAAKKFVGPRNQTCYVATLGDQLVMSRLDELERGLVKTSEIGYLDEPEEHDDGGERNRRIQPLEARLVESSRKPRKTRKPAPSADELEDKSRLSQLRQWTKNKAALQRSLNESHPGWRKYSGKKLLDFWRYVKDYAG